MEEGVADLSSTAESESILARPRDQVEQILEPLYLLVSSKGKMSSATNQEGGHPNSDQYPDIDDAVSNAVSALSRLALKFVEFDDEELLAIRQYVIAFERKCVKTGGLVSRILTSDISFNNLIERCTWPLEARADRRVK